MDAVVPLNSDTSYHTTRQPFIMSLRVHLDRIANSELCPTRGSHLHDAHALQPGRHLPLWALRHSGTHPTGLRLRHLTDRLFSSWT